MKNHGRNNYRRSSTYVSDPYARARIEDARADREVDKAQLYRERTQHQLETERRAAKRADDRAAEKELDDAAKSISGWDSMSLQEKAQALVDRKVLVKVNDKCDSAAEAKADELLGNVV